MSDVLVSKENVQAILTPIIQDIYSKINTLGLSATDKTKLQLINYIINTGDGTKFLSDNGTYKSVDITSLNSASTKINVIYDLFKISGNTYTLNLPSDLQTKLNSLNSTGSGSNVLTDDGTYKNLIGIVVSAITDTDVNTIITNVKALL